MSRHVYNAVHLRLGKALALALALALFEELFSVIRIPRLRSVRYYARMNDLLQRRHRLN